MHDAIAGAGDREVHVVHLGDVYYAGTRTEARTRFLDHWPVAVGEKHPSWCLNGNHDMYSAGQGLTQVVLTDPRFAAQRTTRGAVTSEFLLANRHWSLIGLDTSWKFRWRDPRGGAGHLGRRQVRWVSRTCRPTPSSARCCSATTSRSPTASTAWSPRATSSTAREACATAVSWPAGSGATSTS